MSHWLMTRFGRYQALRDGHGSVGSKELPAHGGPCFPRGSQNDRGVGQFVAVVAQYGIVTRQQASDSLYA